jgi:putative endonuclease
MMHEKICHTYILASQRNGTLYVGVTSDLVKRIYEHKSKSIEGFTSKYNVTMLVHFEEFNDISLAIQREKRLKEWPRKWKLNLIERENPDWKDLYEQIIG